jgi:hypothetical protein
MEINDIKKALYKQKPIAKLIVRKNGVANYDAVIIEQEEPILKYKRVFFDVPESDMGDAKFTEEMDAKLRDLELNIESNKDLSPQFKDKYLSKLKEEADKIVIASEMITSKKVYEKYYTEKIE